LEVSRPSQPLLRNKQYATMHNKQGRGPLLDLEVFRPSQPLLRNKQYATMHNKQGRGPLLDLEVFRAFRYATMHCLEISRVGCTFGLGGFQDLGRPLWPGKGERWCRARLPSSFALGLWAA
jgi:hypothetical protein